MLAIDVRRVRGWLRAGLVEPTPDLDEPRFAFRDLLLLRTLKRLDSELNPRRVRRALAAFKARSPGQSLADLRISTRGARIVVRDATGAFDAASGQRFLDFEAPETSGATVTALRVVPAVDPRLAAADARFKEALVIERDDAQAAESVYREVVALNPEHAEAHINLGCMLHEMGRVLADDAKKAMEAMPSLTDGATTLKAKSKTVPIPLRKLERELVQEARELLDSHPEPMWLDDAKTRISWDWIYAISRLDLDRHCEAHSHFEYEIRAFRIGEVALLALTGEPFVEGQLRIKERSPAPYTFVAHMSNGYVGYVPTAEAIQRGGFETNTSHWSKLVPEALDLIVEESVALLGELWS